MSKNIHDLIKEIEERALNLEQLIKMTPTEFSEYVKKEALSKKIITPHYLWSENRGVVKQWQ